MINIVMLIIIEIEYDYCTKYFYSELNGSKNMFTTWS